LALHGKRYEALSESFVKAISQVMIRALFEAGHQLVISDETHFSRAARDFTREDDKWDTFFVPVPTSAEVCIERAYATNQPDLEPVIKNMAARYEPIGAGETSIALDELDHFLRELRIAQETR
jgi:tRNA uridine 5-carbamoylmethylation protein Kti12